MTICSPFSTRSMMRDSWVFASWMLNCSAAFTIEGVAARAGVGKQAIYRWWSSKGELVFDALLHEQASGTTPALPDSGDLDADLRQLLVGTARDLSDPTRDAIYRAVIAETQHDPALAQQLLDRLLEPLLAATRARLERARSDDAIDADIDLDLAVELLYGPLFHRWLHGRCRSRRRLW